MNVVEDTRTMAQIFSSWEILDADGRHINGTDKHGPNHRYGDAYESLFPDRGAVKLMMEVGIADGSSLLAWRDCFPNAHCVGMDVHKASLLAENPARTEFHLGDQRLRDDCAQAAAGRLFDFICEDATHDLASSLLTLFWLWPYVRVGGIYVVEEWSGVCGDAHRIKALFSNAVVLGTTGPSDQDEPLVVLRKTI